MKTAAPMTKTSASTCAPFDALTGKLFSTGKLVSFCLLFMFCSFCIAAPLFFRPPKIPTGKYHNTTKNRQYPNSRPFPPFPPKSSSFPPPPTRGQVAAGMANQVMAKRRFSAILYCPCRLSKSRQNGIATITIVMPNNARRRRLVFFVWTA